ncbi:MAG: c-type cytochrome [Acidobacteriota bacterium]
MKLRGYFQIMMTGLLLALPVSAQRRAAAQPNPNPFANNADAIAEGREIYNRICTACHGKDGEAGDRALALGAPARRYQRNTDAQIFDAIEKGIPGTMMPPNRLPENDAWKVTAYIHGLRGTAIDTPAKGDVAKGEAIFLGKGKCADCHMVNGKGGLSGPDLSNLAGVRKYTSIVDALTKVQHRVATDGGTHAEALLPMTTYQPVRITTGDGKVINGILRNEDSFTLQVFGSDNQLHLLDRDKLKEVYYIPKSQMPTDFDKRLTATEFQDLLAYLTRLAVPAPQNRGGRDE